MPYEIIPKPRWLHVRYFGDVYPSEVIEQSRHPEFVSSLENQKRIIYDYTGVSQTHFSDDNLAEFAFLGRLFGNTYENIEVACIPVSEERLHRAVQYQALANHANWKVHIFDTVEKAESYFSKDN